MPLLHPHPIEIKGKTYILSKFPATVGREIITQYPTTALPKVGDYKTNHALMLKVMGYVAVERENAEPLQLTTEALVNNHVADAETLMRLEWAMINYNFDFFGNGQASDFLAGLATQVQGLITKTLTDFSRQSSEKG